ncbi:MAG: hypothetical protein MRY83_03490 [Flavobacteriales bacterium]|nr:hypothetical protein [Flavobacteriales bacterium]
MSRVVKIVSGVLFTLVLCKSGLTQSVLLEEDVVSDTIPKSFGPNYDNFWHTYLRYGFIVGPAENETANIRYGRSYDFGIGLRYKRKLLPWYGLGFSLDYSQQNYSIRQDSLKLVPDSIIHKIERLQFNFVNLEFYNRFNFGKRGNIVGKYVDIGVYGSFGFGITHFTRDEYDPSVFGAEIVDITQRKLNYIERLQYGAIARIGFNKLAFFGRYRLSDLFNDERNLAEMPRLVVGVELGLFK